VSNPLTDSQYRALAILAQVDKITPGDFARKMWPDSPGWRRSYKCGPYGASMGIAMARTGGAYLGRLSRKGFVEMVSRGRGLSHSWAITQAGREALERERDNEEK